MRILLVHQNFPGQFKHLAPALVAQGHEVVAMGTRALAQPTGYRYVRWNPRQATGKDGHPWSRDFDTKVIRAEAAFQAARALRRDGFVPDVIVAHPGWGEAMFLKMVWPSASLGLYCEFYYEPVGADTYFDPEFPAEDPQINAAKMRVRNIANELAMGDAVAGIAPTHWQAARFPEAFRRKITVVHDGIDTGEIRPKADVVLGLSNGLVLTRDDEVVTYVARNLEPYRGYHVMMRTLPSLMTRRPKAQFLIVGGAGTSYGRAPPDGKSWRDIFFQEVKHDIDLNRLHFLDYLTYDRFQAVLQVSRVHIYLTYPFVLSWSLMEAMATGCAIVGSNTEPVSEVIDDGISGKLVPFFDRSGLGDRVCDFLEDARSRERMGAAARARVEAAYDLKTVCLPRQLLWVNSLR
jgi:glycosyltransferase involved in cell wall biosynthesis